MLLNLHKKSWMEGLTLQDYSEHCKLNETIVKEMLELAKNYNKVHLFRPHLTMFLNSLESSFYSTLYKTKMALKWHKREQFLCALLPDNLTITFFLC